MSIIVLLLAPFIALSSVVVVNILGISQLADAFGLELLMVSVPAIVGAPLVGIWENQPSNLLCMFIFK